MLESLDDLQHAIAPARPQIDRSACGLLKRHQRSDVPLGQIHDMNVITYARSIGRVLSPSENDQAIAPSNRNLGNEWQEIVWHSLRILTDQAAFMRADRIEITKDAEAPGGIAGR